jgi:hypothetical protein
MASLADTVAQVARPHRRDHPSRRRRARSRGAGGHRPLRRGDGEGHQAQAREGGGGHGRAPPPRDLLPAPRRGRGGGRAGRAAPCRADGEPARARPLPPLRQRQRRRAGAPQRGGGSRLPRLHGAAAARGAPGHGALRGGADEPAARRPRRRHPRGGRRRRVGGPGHRDPPRVLVRRHRHRTAHRLGRDPGGGQARAARPGDRRGVHAGVRAAELLLVGYHLQQQAGKNGQQVDWVAFAAAAPNILWRLGGETVFAVLGGLVGAWYATRMAAGPKLEARVEKA